MIYNNIKSELHQCKLCPLSKDLSYGCFPLHGAGSKVASILVLNLRASEDAHLVEKPVETKYSLLLRQILNKAGKEEKNVFVTNLLKCKGDTTPIRPFRENLNTCKAAWLYKELEAIPTITSIVCLGDKTGQYLLDNRKCSMDDINNNNISINGIRLYSTYSLEEIYRKGQSYMDHAIDIFKSIKDDDVQVEDAGR